MMFTSLSFNYSLLILMKYPLNFKSIVIFPFGSVSFIFMAILPLFITGPSMLCLIEEDVNLNVINKSLSLK